MTEQATTQAGVQTSPRTLLEEVRGLQRAVRTRRHAFWLPLLVFGLLTCASAPMYVRVSGPAANALFRYRQDSETFGMLGGMADPNLTSTSTLRAVYWLITLVVGAVVTVSWYWWHGAVTGLRARVRLSAAIWTGGAVALLVVSLAVLSLVWQLWPLTSTGASGMLVLALGLIGLNWVERSPLLAAITALYTVAALYGVFASPENMLYQLLSAFGVAPAAMPFDEVNVVRVLIPGIVLTLGGLVALAADARHR